MREPFSYEYLKKFMVDQKCIPWFIWERWSKSYIRNFYYEVKARLFNLNSKDYWEKVWGKDIKNIPNWRHYPNKYNKIVSIVAPGSRVLDVGCGMGILMARLKDEKGCDVFGIDLSSTAINYIKSRGLPGLVAEIPPIPALDNSYDVVIGTELIEHFPNPKIILDEILRVLHPSGMFVLSVPENQGPDINKEHLRSYDAESLRKFVSLKVRDFKIISITEDENWDAHLLVCGHKN